MKHGTKIEWTHIPGYKGETWNPWVGCCAVSDGCKNCWALRQANRFKDHQPKYKGTVKNGNWTGLLNRASDEGFYKPLRWRDPRAIFPCSMSDFFHEGADEWREFAWHQIYDTPQHLYLILTKRPGRIPECLPSFGKKEWPWPNVWLGASVENQEHDQRIRDLLNVQAAKRFLSLEPLLGPIVNLSLLWGLVDPNGSYKAGIDWVIVGGESGPGARPMHPDWARSIRDQCQNPTLLVPKVPYFFKQWGEWLPDDHSQGVWREGRSGRVYKENLPHHLWKPGLASIRFGKKKAGRLLDGRTWNEFPKI